MNFPVPELQVEFSVALAEIRRLYLQEALLDTVKKLDIPELDNELGQFVPSPSIALMAGSGLRAELVFPVPIVLSANPRLLAYYRLLFGFSQKLFYTAQTGAGQFKSMETRGIVTKKGTLQLGDLCSALAPCGAALLEGIGAKRVSRAHLDDLTLLTVGPQLRGGANVKRGAAGIVKVFEAIRGIVANSVASSDESQILVKNAAGRNVYIEFAPDPDIVIREEMGPNSFAEKIAIEVKAGEDFSNIHNRLGEAEKSHQKAKSRGFVECWTVVNIDKINMDMARIESPSTNRFYRFSAVTSGAGLEFKDFRGRISLLTGIPLPEQ